MAFNRSAVSSPSTWLVSKVARPKASVPTPSESTLNSSRPAALLTRLMLPPTDPAPEFTELAPFTSSSVSRLKVSVRLYWALSRTPSLVRSALALKPRRLMLSP